MKRVIWCGDFNAHNTVWVGTMNGGNGWLFKP